MADEETGFSRNVIRLRPNRASRSPRTTDIDMSSGWMGSLVQCRRDRLVMTVEEITHVGETTIAKCLWFDGSGHLHQSDRPLSALVRLERAEDFPIQQGLHVRLPSGGPDLVVMQLDPQSPVALCGWMGPGGIPRRRRFRTAVLIPAARRAAQSPDKVVRLFGDTST